MFYMKKTLALITFTVLVILAGCQGVDDRKNDIEHYPTYDTSGFQEHINDPDTSSHVSNTPSENK